MAPPRTDRDKQVFDFLAGYLAAHRRAPSVREIGAALGFSSSSSVWRYLERLKSEGKVDWQPHRARTLRVTAPDGR